MERGVRSGRNRHTYGERTRESVRVKRVREIAGDREREGERGKDGEREEREREGGR